MSARVPLILTVEHGGKEIPPQHAFLFAGKDALLSTHRGYDIGAIELASHLSDCLNASIVEARTSRLLVDLNRSLFSRTLFSEFTIHLPPNSKASILADYYHPHRLRVESLLKHCLQVFPRVVHVGVHTFTPELHGKVRNTDIGLLYHPSRRLEREFCHAWESFLFQALPHRRVRRNYPYRGDSDSLPSYLRCQFPPERYLGLQLEVNQRFPLFHQDDWPEIREALAQSLSALLKAISS